MQSHQFGILLASPDLFESKFGLIRRTNHMNGTAREARRPRLVLSIVQGAFELSILLSPIFIISLLCGMVGTVRKVTYKDCQENRASSRS